MSIARTSLNFSESIVNFNKIFTRMSPVYYLRDWLDDELTNYSLQLFNCGFLAHGCMTWSDTGSVRVERRLVVNFLVNHMVVSKKASITINYIIVLPKISWAGLICRTHQHYHRQWLPNTRLVKFQTISLSKGLMAMDGKTFRKGRF